MISPPAITTVWLSQLAQTRGLEMEWPTEPSVGFTVILLIIGVALLALLAYQIVRRMTTMVKEPGPREALFAELADVHGLSPAERKLLKRLARREKLANPAETFLRKPLLATYAKSDNDARYRQLYRKLFAPPAKPQS
jgi:hypothetical protein